MQDTAEKDAKEIFNFASTSEADSEETAAEYAAKLREMMAEHRKESEEKALNVLRWREQLA